MRSKILSVELIWDHFKRQIWIFAILSLLLILAYPLSTWMVFENFQLQGVTAFEEVYRQYLFFIKERLALVGLPMLAGGALLNGVTGFRFLHSAKMADFYHSLPIRREKLFWNLVVSGVILYGVPEIFAALLSLCVGASQGYFSMELVGAMAVSVGLHLLFYLFMYGTAILAMMLTGRLAMGILGALAFLSYVPMAVFLFIDYGDTFFTTFNSLALEGSLLLNVGNYGSPLAWYLEVQGRFAQGEAMGRPLGAAAVVIALVFWLDRFLYRKRPLEAAGQSMVFAPVAKVVKVFLVVPAALLLAMIAYNISPASSRQIWWAVGLLLGVLITHGVLEMVYHADYKKFFSHRMELLAEAVLTAAVAAVFVFDLTGYDQYLPNREEIAWISMDPMTLTDEQRLTLAFNEQGEPYVNYGGRSRAEGLQLPADEEMYGLMKKLIEAQKPFDWGRGEDGEESYLSVDVWYRLNNGKWVARNYRFSRKDGPMQELEALWGREEFRLGMYSQLEENKPYLQQVYFLGMEEALLYQVNEEERFEILEALLADLKEATQETYQEECVGMLGLEYRRGDWSESNYLGTDTVNIYPGYTRTLERIRERGGVEGVLPPAEEVTKITVYDYRTEPVDGSYPVEEQVFRKEEEIREILPHLIVRDHWSFQLPETEGNLFVEVETTDKKGRIVTLDCAFLEGEAPGFIGN